MKHYQIILIIVVSFLAGYYLRGLHKEDVNYVALPAVKGSAVIDTPKTVKNNDVSNLPIIYWKHDTLRTVPDTAKIISEFLKEKTYNLTLFDDKEKGKLEVQPKVQFNGLSAIDYTYTPIQREIIKKRRFEPFVGASCSTLEVIGVGGGFFYDNVGMEYQYERASDGRYGHALGLKIKF